MSLIASEHKRKKKKYKMKRRYFCDVTDSSKLTKESLTTVVEITNSAGSQYLKKEPMMRDHKTGHY